MFISPPSFCASCRWCSLWTFPEPAVFQISISSLGVEIDLLDNSLEAK